MDEKPKVPKVGDRVRISPTSEHADQNDRVGKVVEITRTLIVTWYHVEFVDGYKNRYQASELIINPVVVEGEKNIPIGVRDVCRMLEGIDLRSIAHPRETAWSTLAESKVRTAKVLNSVKTTKKGGHNDE